MTKKLTKKEIEQYLESLRQPSLARWFGGMLGTLIGWGVGIALLSGVLALIVFSWRVILG